MLLLSLNVTIFLRQQQQVPRIPPGNRDHARKQHRHNRNHHLNPGVHASAAHSNFACPTTLCHSRPNLDCPRAPGLPKRKDDIGIGRRVEEAGARDDADAKQCSFHNV